MTANPKPASTEAARRAAIKHRRETSTFWMAVHLLGSLNVAVILLVTIAGMIAFATVMESKFDTAVARYYIYDNPLFMVWLLVLALNLLCAAFTRWPWQRKHLGFVVTHAGIILMLAGSMIGKIYGFEAFVTLDKTKPPESRLFTKDNILTIATSSGVRGQMPFDTEMRPPSEARPFTLPLENSKLRLVIDRTTENLVPDDSLVASTDTVAPFGVALHFVNAGMGQNVAANLMQGEGDDTYDFFGMAKVLLVDSLDEAHPIAPVPDATVPAATASSPRDETPFHETQLVMANAPQAPIVDTDVDLASGYRVLLDKSGKDGAFVATVIGLSGATKQIPVTTVAGGWINLMGDGDPIVFRVAKYWPNFAMKDGVPISLSDEPKNPAVLVQITGPTKLLPPPAPPKSGVASNAAPPLPQGLVMRIAPAKEAGRIVYELERAGKITARARVAQGETIHLGWSKWEAQVDAILPHAELHREMKEFAGTVTPMMAASLRPGLRAHMLAPDGTSGPVEWIPEGTSRELFGGSDFARIGYGQRVIPLNFSITLEDFQVPRDEGTDTPANYISSLRFTDTTGRSVRDTAEMNSPAMFPGDFWRSLLGWNYKFSQANWNPDNLNETTLQVLYDPGWPFKWVGSLGICCGIALMFYFMPKRSAAERGGRESESAAAVPAAEASENRL